MKLVSIPSVVVSFAFLILISLGCWQISRLSEKNSLINLIRSDLNAEATLLPDYIDTKSFEAYKKYKLTGKFLVDKNIFLYSSNPQHAERHGYFIITPFELGNGRIIMINRGWIPQSLRPTFISEKIVDNQATSIEAMVMFTKKPNIFIPKNDLKRNIWTYIDLKAIEDYIKIPADQGFYMILINGENLHEQLIIRRAEDFLQIKNDHLWYAITWFSLAAALTIIYYYRTR